jgi:phosphopantothenate-cysteine ligase
MAAAVSDFYIPDEKLSSHKIQSKEHKDGLTITLDPVPKKLGQIVESWNPETMLVRHLNSYLCRCHSN